VLVDYTFSRGWPYTYDRLGGCEGLAEVLECGDPAAVLAANHLPLQALIERLQLLHDHEAQQAVQT